MNIGMIGLGQMGEPMALNLLKAGHQLLLCDINASAVERVVVAGQGQAQAIATPKEIAEMAPNYIISMLPSSPHVQEVYLGEQGLLMGKLSIATFFIDCSTIDPKVSRLVREAAGHSGLAMVDAPVSGGTGAAKDGTLTFMVGGTDAEFAQVKPILELMGKNIVHCGPSGNGQVAKVANNMLLAVTMIGVSEAMCLGTQLGMDPTVLAGIINTSSGRCWSSDTYNPYPGVNPNAPASRDYQGGFSNQLMLKDVMLATEAAKAVNQPTPLASLAQVVYQTIYNQGLGDLDFSSVIKLFQKN